MKMSIIRQDSFLEESSSSVGAQTSSSSTTIEGGRTIVTSMAKGSVKTEVQFSSSSSNNSGSLVAREKRETVMHTVVGVGLETCLKGATNEESANTSSDLPSTTTETNPQNGGGDPCVTENLLGLTAAELEMPQARWMSDGLEKSTPQNQNHPPHNIGTLIEEELKKRDKIIENLLLLNPLPAFPVKSIEGRVQTTSGTPASEEELRSELAALRVKVSQQEEDLRETRTSLSKKEGRLQELTRQLDAHRQEHARQAATIVSLRQRLQDECELTSRLRGQQGRAELTMSALTRENKFNNDRILELESRLRTHLEERESAEQKSDSAQKKLSAFLRILWATLNLEGDLEANDAQERVSAKLGELVKECGFLRGEVSRLREANVEQEESAGHARQTVARLVTELDEQKETADEQKKFVDNIQRECEGLRSRARGLEEEVKSIRDRLHNTNRSYNSTLEELHNTEKLTQYAKDEALVAEHRRLQSEASWKGFLTTLSALLSTPSSKVPTDVEALTEKVQAIVTCAKEGVEQGERLSSHLASVEEQNKRQHELYNSALKRARQSEADAQASCLRGRQLEAELTATESAREDIITQRDKAVSVMARVVDALGLKELGEEVTKDVELVVCRAQQLAKLEGEKIVDKTTTVYQLQRRVKSLREAVERKDLHVDMLRRKLAMLEDASRATAALTEERDEAAGRCRRLSRTIDRLSGELNDARHQVRDLREQMAENSDDKAKLKHLHSKVDELSAKVEELDSMRTKQQKKIAQLKEQMKAYGEHSLEERRLHDSSLEGMTHDLANSKQALRDANRREKQLSEFRRAVMDLLMGSEAPDDAFGAAGDIEVLSRLEKLMATYREFNDLSRRLDDITSPTRPRSAHQFPSHSIMHAHFRPSSPMRPSSVVPVLHSHGRSSPSEFSMNDLFPEDLHSLMDAAQNQRPPARKSRPSSARSRTPSPQKDNNTSDEEEEGES